MLTYALKVKRLAARIAVVSMNVRRIRDIGLQSSLKATRRDGHLFVDVTCCRRPKRTAETVDFLSVTVFCIVQIDTLICVIFQLVGEDRKMTYVVLFMCVNVTNLAVTCASAIDVLPKQCFHSIIHCNKTKCLN